MSTDADVRTRAYDVSAFDLYALGITIVIGGQYFGWNEGLFAGSASVIIGTIILGMAYICLCSCMSELSSAIPFAGGSYGLARCTLGNWVGFVVGCSECLEYIVYVADSTVSLGEMFEIVNPKFEGYGWVVWIIFFFTSISIHLSGGWIFWRFNSLLAIVSMILLIIFIISSFQHVDFDKYAHSHDFPSTRGGMESFMRALPLCCWFFVGVESINFAANDSTRPKKVIPVAQTLCVLTLFVTACFVVFTACSLPPGVQALSEDISAVNHGYSLAFSISVRGAMIFSIPATYATAFGFQYSYGNIMVAMSDSKLLPSFLQARYKGKSYGALIVGSIISISICLLINFVAIVRRQVFNVCILCAFLCYFAQCIGYIHLKLKFPTLHREFQSPFGLFGAFFALLVWFLGIIAVMFFQTDSGFAVIVVVILIVVESVYYHLVAYKGQILSADERSMLFFAKEKEILSVSHAIRSFFISWLSRGESQAYENDNVEEIINDMKENERLAKPSAEMTMMASGKVLPDVYAVA